MPATFDRKAFVMRTVVIGASSGLGRCIGIGLGQKGDSVALLARRHDRLVQAAQEAGPGALAIACDVTDEASVKGAIAEAAAGLGGIDSLVYATGIGPLAKLVDLDAATWRQAFDTNVIGASLATAAAAPYLQESGGTAIYLSSVSASMTAPWPGLAAYTVSKAALDKLVDAWRAEHPDIGFTRITVGDCVGGEGDSLTEFNASWDHALMGEVYPVWTARGYIANAFLDVDELVRVVHTVLQQNGTTASVPSIILTPRPKF